MSQPELWVIAERRLAHIEPTTQQLITKAKSIAGTTFKVVTILLEAPTDHLEDELTPYAPDEIRIARMNASQLLPMRSKPMHWPNSLLLITPTRFYLGPRLPAAPLPHDFKQNCKQD